MTRRTRLLCAGITLMIAGCQAGPPQLACSLPGQARMISLKLYFGRDIPGGGFVTDAAWSSFTAAILTPAFPAGFTVYEAVGQWRNPETGQIVHERSFVVETLSTGLADKVAAVTEAYRKTFHQLSVGQVSQTVCAAF